jgi:hypothetical protein
MVLGLCGIFMYSYIYSMEKVKLIHLILYHTAFSIAIVNINYLLFWSMKVSALLMSGLETLERFVLSLFSTMS